MSEKARIVRTITDLGYAPITAIAEDGTPTYAPVKWLPHHKAGGRSYSADPTGAAVQIWADGREVYAYEDNQGYDNTVTTIGVTDDVEEDWYGHNVDTDGSVEEYANDDSYPYFALIIIEDTTDGLGKTTIWYFCHISERSSQQGQTSEGSGISPQFPQHKIACRPRLDCRCVKKTIPAKAKITAIPEPSVMPHITLDKDAIDIVKGLTHTLNVVSVNPADAAVTWASDTTAVATVTSGGVVSGVAAGTANISASITTGGKTYTDTCVVTVKQPYITLAEDTATIAPEGSIRLDVSGMYPAGSTVTWSSSDTDKMTVDSDGVVTGKTGVTSGYATITASITVGGVSYVSTCTVTISAE